MTTLLLTSFRNALMDAFDAGYASRRDFPDAARISIEYGRAQTVSKLLQLIIDKEQSQ